MGSMSRSNGNSYNLFYFASGQLAYGLVAVGLE